MRAIGGDVVVLQNVVVQVILRRIILQNNATGAARDQYVVSLVEILEDLGSFLLRIGSFVG